MHNIQSLQLSINQSSFMFRDKLAVLQTLASTVNRVSSSVGHGNRSSCPSHAIALCSGGSSTLAINERWDFYIHFLCGFHFCLTHFAVSLKPPSSAKRELQLPVKAVIF